MSRALPVLCLSTLVSTLTLSACGGVEPPVDSPDESGTVIATTIAHTTSEDEAPAMQDGPPMTDPTAGDGSEVEEEPGEEPPPAEEEEEPAEEEPSTGPREITIRLSNVAPWTLAKSGTFDTPVGRTAPGGLRGGDAYEVTFTAGDRHRLSFATMLGSSNDWFYATQPEGIALYEDGVPLSGDVTDRLRLYDAGTEIDQEPGVGDATGPLQSQPEEGADDALGYVRQLPNPVGLADGSVFHLPGLDEVLQVTITSLGQREFRLRVANVSGEGALQTSTGPQNIALSPGVWVLHGGPDALFTLGSADRGEGLDELAESGRVRTLSESLAEASGVATGFSPAQYVVHHTGEPLFTAGTPDRGLGLEEVAESGNTSVLNAELGVVFPEGATQKGVMNLVEGAEGPGPLRPGQTYVLTVTAEPGDRISFASMFGASNDWIIATPSDGIALFDDDGRPLTGDFTADLGFYDVGTEIDEEPGVGAHTGPNQSGPDDGPADPDANVRMVDPATYATPVAAHLELHIEAAQP